MTSQTRVSPAIFRTSLACGLIAGLLLVAGMAVAPDRSWSNLLIVTFYLTTLGLGGALFIALTYVCGASWNVPFRRIPEALADSLTPASLGLLAVVVAGSGRYAWHAHGEEAGTLWFKEMWADPTFLILRAIVYIGSWILFSKALVTVSRKQDRSGRVELTYLNRRLSAAFLVVYAITFSLASIDWLMLLEPMWFSTIWGVYNFAGTMLSTLAAMIVLAILLRAHGPLRGYFTDDQLHDLGKLTLGFSCFWMYIWFSQYMLIWYTNIPEETSYFITRTKGPWGPLMAVNVLLNWVVPFFVLLPRPSKRNERIMMRIAAVLLIGRWVDLYVMVLPSTLGAQPVFGLWELAGIVLLIGAFGWLFIRSFGKVPPVPIGDPLLSASLHKGGCHS